MRARSTSSAPAPGTAPGRRSASCSAPASAISPSAVDGVAIDYADLPGFPQAGVSGHQPRLVVGDLEGVRVAVFGGRAHYYEKRRRRGDAPPARDAARRSAPAG